MFHGVYIVSSGRCDNDIAITHVLVFHSGVCATVPSCRERFLTRLGKNVGGCLCLLATRIGEKRCGSSVGCRLCLTRIFFRAVHRCAHCLLPRNCVQTLRRSSAAMLRSGARPVAVTPTPEGLDLVWETLTEDLVAVQAGKLSVNIIEDPPGLR